MKRMDENILSASVSLSRQLRTSGKYAMILFSRLLLIQKVEIMYALRSHLSRKDMLYILWYSVFEHSLN